MPTPLAHESPNPIAVDPPPCLSRFLIVMVLIIAALLRLPALDTVPPPLNQDEASRGYDAWSLLETGADRNGDRWPWFLKSFGQGDYTAALSTYLTIPFIKLLGPTTIAMRLPDALLGVLTVGALYSLLRSKFGFRLAISAAAVLACDPWHVSLTRTAHESGFAPALLAFALLSMHRAGLLPASIADQPVTPTRYSPHWALLAGLMFAAHTWVYPATRLLTPLLLIAMLLIQRHSYVLILHTPSRRPILMAAIGGLFLGAWPILSTAITHPNQLAARAGTVLLTSTHPMPSFAALLISFLNNYVSNFNPRYLYWAGEDMTGISFPGFGMHLLITAPLILIGFVQTIFIIRRDAWARFLIAWLILAPLPAAICRDWNPHPMRTIGAMLLGPVFAAQGVVWLVEKLSRLSPTIRNGLIVTAALAFAANAGVVFNAYFRQFPLLAEPGYQTPLVRAMQYVAGRRDADFVLVTGRVNMAYIYALLYEPIRPEQRLSTPSVIGEDATHFHEVLRLGRYYFSPQFPEDSPEAVRIFRQCWSGVPANSTGLVIDRPGLFKGGRPLATFPACGGRRPEYDLEVRQWSPDSP